MEIFGSRRRHAWGKEDVWESYTITTNTVAPTPTTNTSTVAAQVGSVYCLITIQHEGKVFCDTMMCHLAKVRDTSRDCTAFIYMGLQSFGKS